MKNDAVDISLSHPSIHLDVNNKNDVQNLDQILSLIIKQKNNKKKLIEILEHTSFKYLKRLQEDGLIADTAGENVVPVYNPIVLDKALYFKSKGGYSRLYKKQRNLDKPSRYIKWLGRWWWSIVVPLIIGLILLAIEKKWF
jgi:hypothetical protein